MDNQVSIVLLKKDYTLTEEDELVMMMSTMINDQKGLLVKIEYLDNNDNDNDDDDNRIVNIILNSGGYYLRFYLLNKYDVDCLIVNKSVFLLEDCVDIDDKTIINCYVENN